MLTRTFLCLLFPASLLSAQEAPAASARDAGLDLRFGYSRPERPVSRTVDDRTLVTGGVPTFDVDGRLLAAHGISAHLSGALMTLQPLRYSRAGSCFELCEGFTSYAAALQIGATVRVSQGPAYAAFTLAERGTVEGPLSCWAAYCALDLLFRGDATLRSVNRLGIGLRPRGTGVRPTAEASVSFWHPSVGTYRRELELGAGVAF